MSLVNLLKRIKTYENGLYDYIKLFCSERLKLQEKVNTLGEGYQIVPYKVTKIRRYGKLKGTVENTQIFKIVRNNKTAVAVSGSYGAGWSTWNNINPLDARFNILFLKGLNIEAMELCDSLDLGFSGGGLDVDIEWVDIGDVIRIREYDGSENIEYMNLDRWITA